VTSNLNLNEMIVLSDTTVTNKAVTERIKIPLKYLCTTVYVVHYYLCKEIAHKDSN